MPSRSIGVSGWTISLVGTVELWVRASDGLVTDSWRSDSASILVTASRAKA